MAAPSGYFFVIELAGLAKTYSGVPVLGPLALKLRAGEVTGLLGPNGAGKTTAMRLMAGVLSPSAGEVLLNGKPDPNRHPALRALIGYLPEGFAQPPELTIWQVLRFSAAARGIPASDKAIARAAQLTSLTHRLYDKAGSLSKGYRCRLGLAAAILHDPPILLLDEPADGLDPLQKKQIYRLIRDWRQAGKTLILSTHNLEEAALLCDRFVLISQGNIKADLPAGETDARSLQTHFDQFAEAEQ